MGTQFPGRDLALRSLTFPQYPTELALAESMRPVILGTVLHKLALGGCKHLEDRVPSWFINEGYHS